MSYDIKIIKTVKNSNVFFDCEDDNDLIKQVDKLEYSVATVNDSAKVTYTIQCDGYLDVSNTLIVDKNYELTPVMKKWVTLTIVPYPDDSTVIITFNGKDHKTKQLKVTTNTPIKYTVKRERRQTVSDTVILESDKTIEVKLSMQIKNDGDIGEYEGEYTDPLADIKLISKKDYENMTDKIRRNHIKYNDLISYFLGVDTSTTLNDIIVQLYWLLPIAQKLTPFTNGSLGHFQADFINLLSQLNSLLVSAKSAGSKIKKIKKKLKKVGLSKVADIFTVAFGLIGGLAGIMYAVMNNPAIFIKTYAQAFQDIDLDEIYNRTIGQTIPNLEYVKGMLNRTYIPEGDLKRKLFDHLEELDAAADLSLDVISDLASLKEMVEVANSSEEAMQEIIKQMSTMSLGWALGSLSDAIAKLGKDRDKIKRTQQNNNLSDAYRSMQENIDKILNNDDYYISIDDMKKLEKIKDERTSTEKIMDYQNGYNDAFENGYNGETEFEMDAKLSKLKREMEALGKDPSSYIYGYRTGWKAGRNKYENELNHITTEEQKESYEKGYADGANFGKLIRDLAINSLNIGELKWFIDMDKHIHNINFTPFGRISNDIVYDFNEDMSEHQIGTYNSTTDIIHLNTTNKDYLVVDYRYIYDTTITQEITDEKIAEIINIFYKINVMRVERQPAEGMINPFYAKGWVDGYVEQEEDNEEINNDIEIDELGYGNGYVYAAHNEPTSKITEEIEGYKEQNEEKYEFYAQGLIRGYNTYQSEYNSGYNSAYFSSMKSDEYEEGENPEISKQEYLAEYCEEMGLNKTEQDTLPDYEKNSSYLGAINGWDDAYNGLDQQFREGYYLNY